MPKPKIGTYQVQCDYSGGIFRSDQCVTTWDNKLVYREFAYPKNPQDWGISCNEIQSVPHGRGTDNLAITPPGEFNNDFNNDFD